MIKNILFFSLVILTLSVSASGPTLSFVKESEDLGTLYTDALEPVVLNIEFENTGNQPLVISAVRGCCGTRITDYTKSPVRPGEKGFVKAEFRLTPQPHKINRTVSIMSNDSNGMKVFKIKGEVAETGSIPFGSQAVPSGPGTAGSPRTN
jgi:hypothetical protein